MARKGEQVMRIRRLKWFLGVPLALAVLTAAAFWVRPVSFFQGYSELRMYLSGAQSLTTTVAGYRVHYYTMGPETGLPVVLVHGLGARAEDWQNLAPYLARAGYRVYLPDLPGYGQSERPATFSYSVPDEAAVVVGFLDALGLKQVDLGGWSMGGWIVQRVAASQPARVRKLLLFDSAGIYEVPAWDTRLFTPTTPAELDQLDALLMPAPPKVPDFIAGDILRHSERNAWVIQRALASMLTGRYTTDGLLPGLKMPVLIVWGAEDRITPLSQAVKMHNLVPQSQLDVIPGCGHLAPSQCVAQVGPRVVAFVGQ
jgi:pimeloyl-ACP methyl ester carboxylesterase